MTILGIAWSIIAYIYYVLTHQIGVVELYFTDVTYHHLVAQVMMSEDVGLTYVCFRQSTTEYLYAGKFFSLFSKEPL